MYKKTLSLLMALLMISSAAAGCSESSVDKETENSNITVGNDVQADTDAESDITVNGEERVYPELPEDLNFDGHTFTIMNNDHPIPLWGQTDIYAEEMTGSAINDAVFKRNTAVSEQYNCTIASEKTLSLATELANVVKTDDDYVDLATVRLREFALHAQEKYYIELHNIESMDLTNPWYDQNSVSELSIKNKLYGVASDITLMDKQATTAMVFNKALYEDYQVAASFGDFYELVKEGKWTYEVMKSMVASVSADLDGDSERTENDLYGMLYQRDTLTSFLNGFGIRFASKNSEDIPEMTLMNENGVDVLDQIFNLLYSQDCMNVMSFFGEENWSDDMVKMFNGNKALLMWIRLADVENLRSMDVDFGIIPIPKYTEEQDNYMSSINSYIGTVTCVPVTNYNPEMTGYFIEALASESRYVVLPEYYEINLKGKVVRDEESREMLDLIFGNRVYDLGEIYDPGNFANTLIYMTMKNDRDVASKWAKNMKMINKTLDKMLRKFD